MYKYYWLIYMGHINISIQYKIFLRVPHFHSSHITDTCMHGQIG